MERNFLKFDFHDFNCKEGSFHDASELGNLQFCNFMPVGKCTSSIYINIPL